MIKPSVKNISLVLLGCAVIGACIAYFLMPRKPPLEVAQEPLIPFATERPNINPLLIAHRGASLNAPGNSLVAIERAIELGFDYVEADVRYTRDGIPVLFHDRTVDAETDGSGELKDFTYAELQELDAGSWYSEEFAGIRVASLEDALKLMQGKICLLWHAKEPPRRVAVDLVHEYGFSSGCVVIALHRTHDFDSADKGVAALSKMWKNAPLAITVKNEDVIPEVVRRYPGVRLLDAEARFVSPELADVAHSFGLRVYSRAVDNLDNTRVYRWVLEAGGDGLMLKNIEGLRAFIAEGTLQPREPGSPKFGESAAARP